MIARTYIESNLKQLDRLYNLADTDKMKLYYSKLAMLELCGWIEESMDDVVIKCANRVLKSSSNKGFVLNEVVGPTHGFEYKKHFRKMMVNVIGLIYVEKIERSIDQLKHDQLKSALGNLKAARNKEAHTHLKGVTRTVDAPSITINNFNFVYDGLIEYQEKLKSLGL